MSYRNRVPDSQAVLPATTYGQSSQIPRTSRPTTDKISRASQRLSMTSNSSAGRRSSASFESSVNSNTARPSGIPRPSRTASTTRQNILVPSKTSNPQPYRVKTSTNITGISNRTTTHQRSTDRITPIDNTPRIVTDEDLLSLEPTLPTLDMDHDTIFGIVMPQKKAPQPSNLPPRLIPELQALAATSYRRPTPAMSAISTISSPSTRSTTTPSPWSASTTATTPTSWSSASPSLVQPSRLQPVSKRSQTVPIPTTTRSAMPKLPILRETNSASTSNSKPTIQPEEVHTPKKLKKKTPINSPAPTPPPRTSSVKRNRSRSNSKNEDQPPSLLQIPPPLPSEQEHTLITKASGLNDNHLKLQEAINFIPSRPSRDGTEDFILRRPHLVYANQAHYNEQTRKLLEAAPIEALPQSMFESHSQSSRVKEPEPPVPPLPSRSRLAKFSKLGLFGRSPKKSSTDAQSAHQPQNALQRGPSAGTGHEGYGRFGRRDRKTSTDGNTTGTDSESSVVSIKRKTMRSTSRKDSSSSFQRNRMSQSDLDDFASTRLKPKVILGGSQKLNSESETEFGQFDIAASNDQTQQTSVAEDRSRQPSVVSSGPLMRESRLIFHLDSLDAHDPSKLALRRSQKFDKSERFPMPQPILTGPSFNHPYPSGYNTSQSSLGANSVALTDNSGDLYRVDSRLLERQRKKSHKLNWGFFKKKEVTPESYKPRTTSRSVAPLMPVRVSVVPPSRPTPYYAMSESENDLSTTEAIGDYLTEAARAMQMDGEDDVISPIEQPEPSFREQRNSVLLPSAPSRKFEGKQRIPSATTSTQPIIRSVSVSSPQITLRPRQPRLAQVGRIPKVIPTTQQIAPTHVTISNPPRNVINHSAPTIPSTESTGAVGPLPSGHAKISTKSSLRNVETDRPRAGPSRPDNDLKGSAKHSRFNEFLRLADRYSTTSSSSDGMLSVMGPPLLPTAEFPTRSIRYTTTEDDVWNEYDEFIDRVTSPHRLKKSTTRITDNDRTQALPPNKSEASEDVQLSIRRTLKNLAINTSLVPPPPLFAPRSLTEDRDTDDFRLRRSRIISALHSSLDPSSPYSINDYLAELGEPRRASGRTSGRLSDSQISQGSLQSPRLMTAFPEPPTLPTEYRHYDNTTHMDELERSKDPARHSERSYASLMVSRWLSFGRVLFSPAHSDLEQHTERHVLVIDGLGNEDWSIYCSVTYQKEQAYIYDLKETGHTRSMPVSNKADATPNNFRRREIASFAEVFKFPDNFFSVIVLRFPPVMPESKLKNIMSQCRRVLAPGGYMELVLLDLDIVNMGVSTRRALRDLKTKIAMRNREVSLKPVIDNMQSVLCEKGFSKLSKCVVGVPVVGRPAGAESPTSSRSSGASDGPRQTPSAGPRPFDKLKDQNHHNFSLNDLVADHSENADAKIGRVVSRTARSWWQHCFEAAVISDGDLSKSIFADKQVLSECKARASSFKLLIAYTQKPGNTALGGKRRTMSEPIVATLATAGSP